MHEKEEELRVLAKKKKSTQKTDRKVDSEDEQIDSKTTDDFVITKENVEEIMRINDAHE